MHSNRSNFRIFDIFLGFTLNTRKLRVLWRVFNVLSMKQVNFYVFLGSFCWIFPLYSWNLQFSTDFFYLSRIIELIRSQSTKQRNKNTIFFLLVQSLSTQILFRFNFNQFCLVYTFSSLHYNKFDQNENYRHRQCQSPFRSPIIIFLHHRFESFEKLHFFNENLLQRVIDDTRTTPTQVTHNPWTTNTKMNDFSLYTQKDLYL